MGFNGKRNKHIQAAKSFRIQYEFLNTFACYLLWSSNRVNENIKHMQMKKEWWKYKEMSHC